MSQALLVVEKGSKQHRRFLGTGVLYLFLMVTLVPLWLEPFQLGKMNRALVIGVAILGLNLVVGFNGMLALGHSAFMGFGAFMTASMIQDENWDYWMVIPVVLIVGFLFGLITGLPALRVKGLYLALITIALAFVFPTLVNIDELGIAQRTGGPNGRKVDEEVIAPNFMEWLPGVEGPRGGSAYRYWVIILVVAITMLVIRNMIRSRAGRAVIAIRDNEAGAAVYGVNLPLYKSVNFAVSGALGFLAGLLWSMDKAFVAGQDFTFLLAIDLIIGLVIGGVGTLQGSLVGGLFVVWVRDLTKNVSIPLFGLYNLDGAGPLANAIFGLILILFTFFAPGGIVSIGRMIGAKMIQVIPIKPDGDPMVTAESLDAGPDSTRAKSGLIIATAGLVLPFAGYFFNLAVGTEGFNMFLWCAGAIVLAGGVICAPFGAMVGLSEFEAAEAGRRTEAAKSTAMAAMVLGGLVFVFHLVFALQWIIRSIG